MRSLIDETAAQPPVASVTASLLQQQLNMPDPPYLIDVREPWEVENYNIGGVCIPLSQIMQRVSEIPADIPVVVYCEKGIRSTIAIQKLSDKFGFTNLINLKDGMQSWKKNFQ